MEVTSLGTNSEPSEFFDKILHCPLCSRGFPDSLLLTHHIKLEHRDWTLYKVVSEENEIHRIPGYEVLQEVDDINQCALHGNGDNENNAISAEFSEVTVRHLPEVSLCSEMVNASDSDDDVQIIEPNSEDGYYSWRQKTVPPIYDISVSETESENGEETDILTCEGDNEIFLRSFQGAGYIKTAEKRDFDVICNETAEECHSSLKEQDEKSYARIYNRRRCKREKKTLNIQKGNMFIGRKNFRKHRGGKIIIASVPSSRVWVNQGTCDDENDYRCAKTIAKSSKGLESIPVDRKVSCLHSGVTLQKNVNSDLGSSEIIPPSPNKLNLFNNSMNINIINVTHGSTRIQNDLIDGGKFPAISVDSSECSIVAEGLGSYTTLSVIEQSEPLNINDFIIACKIKTESSLSNCSATAARTSQIDSENKCQCKLPEDVNDGVSTKDTNKLDLEETVVANESISGLTYNAGVNAVLTKESYLVQSECVNSTEKSRNENEITDNIRGPSINQDVLGRAKFCWLSDFDEQDSLNGSKGCINLNIKNTLAKCNSRLDETLDVPDGFDDESTFGKRVESNFLSWDCMESDSAGDLTDQLKNLDYSVNVKKNYVFGQNPKDCDNTEKGSLNCKKSRSFSDSARVDTEGTDKSKNPSCTREQTTPFSEQTVIKDIDSNHMDSAVNQTTKNNIPEPLVSGEVCVKVDSTKSDVTFAVPYYPAHRRQKRSYLSDCVFDDWRKKSVSKNIFGNSKNILTKEFENVDRDKVSENVYLNEQEATSCRREQHITCTSQFQDNNVSYASPAEGDCQNSSGYVSEKSVDISSGEGQMKAEPSNICTAQKIVSIEDNETLKAKTPEHICELANQSENSFVNDPENYKSNAKEIAFSGSSCSQFDETSDCQKLTEENGLKTTASTLNNSKGYKCKKCLMELENCQSLKSHRCTVPGLKPFKCSKCLFSFSRKRHLVLHVQKCSRKRERQSLLDQKSNHMGMLKNRIESECFICFKKVSSKFQLVQHLFRFHADVVKLDTVKSKILSNLDITEDWDSEFTTTCNLKNDIDSFQTTGNTDHLDLAGKYPEDSHSVKDQAVTLDQTNTVQNRNERGDISVQENPSAVVNVSKDDSENHDRKKSEEIIADMGPPANKNILKDDHEYHEIKSSESLSDPLDCQANKNALQDEGACHERKKSKEIISDILKYLPKDLLQAKLEKSSIPLGHTKSPTKLPICMYCGKKFVRHNGFRSHMLECVNNRAGHKSNICSKIGLTNSDKALNYNEQGENSEVNDKSVFLDLKGNISTKLFYKSNVDVNEEKSYVCPTCSSLFSDKQSFQDHQITHKSAESVKFPNCGDALARVEAVRKQTSMCVSEKVNNTITVDVDEEVISKHVIKENIATEILKSSIEMDPTSTLQKTEVSLSVLKSSKIHKCLFCSKAYVSKYTLKYHLLKCHNYKLRKNKAKLYKCIYCSKAYRSKNTLKYHYQVCSGIVDESKQNPASLSCEVKPNICELCGRIYSNKYNLAYHYQKCAGGLIRNCDVDYLDRVSYKCFYCAREFASKYTLKYHLRKCKMVTHAFGKDESYMEVDKIEIGEFENHLEVNSNRQEVQKAQKLYKCFVCDRNFRSYYSLYNHKVNKHSDLMKIEASGNLALKKEACVGSSDSEDSPQTIDDAVNSKTSCPVSAEEKQVTYSRKHNYSKNYPGILAQDSVLEERQDSSPVKSTAHNEKQQTLVSNEKKDNKQVNMSQVNDFLGFTASLVCNYCGIAFADSLYFKLHLTKHRNKFSFDRRGKTFELKVLVEKLYLGASDGIFRHVNLKEKSLKSDLGASVGDLAKIVKLETVDKNQQEKYGGNFHTCSAEENHSNRNDNLPDKQNYVELEGKERSLKVCFSDVKSAGKKLKLQKLNFGDVGDECNCKFQLTRRLGTGARGKYFNCSVHGKIHECKARAIQHKHMHSNENARFTVGKDVHRRKKLGKHSISRVLDTTKAIEEEKAQYGNRHRCRECGKTFQTKASLCHHKVAHLRLPRYYCLECGKSFKYTSCLNRHFVYFHPEVKPLEGKSFSVGKP